MEEAPLLVKLGEQIKVADNADLRPRGDLVHLGEVHLRRRVRIAAEALGEKPCRCLRIGVHAAMAVHRQFVHGADHIVVRRQVERRSAHVPLDAQIHLDAPGVLVRQRAHLGAVIRQPLHGAFPVVFKRHRAVHAHAHGRKARVPAGEDHLLDRRFTVVPGGVHVQILGNHLIIFSCLTFLSMTWREAISFLMSSRLMPISIISTIT